MVSQKGCLKRHYKEFISSEVSGSGDLTLVESPSELGKDRRL